MHIDTSGFDVVEDSPRFPRPIMTWLGYLESEKQRYAKNHHTLDVADTHDLKEKYEKYREEQLNQLRRRV